MVEGGGGRVGAFAVVGGTTVRLTRDGMVEVPDSAELRALIALRDAALALLRLEADLDAPVGPLADARALAAERYAGYVERWGPLNRGELDDSRVDTETGLPLPRWRRPALGGFRQDPDYLTVIALEVYDAGTGRAGPAPILQRPVHGRHRHHGRATLPGGGLLRDGHPAGGSATVHLPGPTDGTDPLDDDHPAGDGPAAAGSLTVAEAVLVCRARGALTPAHVARLAGLAGPDAAESALVGLAFRDPEQDGRWVPAAEYLSGDVRARHRVAVAAAAADDRYAPNVEALTAAIPDDVGPLEIAVSLGAPWIAPEDVEAFAREELGERVKVWHLPSAASWKVVRLAGRRRGGGGAYGTARLSGLDLLSAGLNGRAPVVADTAYVAGRRTRRRDVGQSLAAQEQLSAMQQRFAEWLWQDAERTERLCAEYNRRFNAHRVRREDGSLLGFPGMADGVRLWPWQRDIVARIVSSPATLCAHAVGAGKTRSMVAAAMTARRLGLADKPLIAVPSHLVEQTAREARQAYPFGRFLISGEDGASSRALLTGRCATGEWDAVIVSHGTFSALPVDPVTETAWLRRSRAEIGRQLAAGKGGRHGRSVLQRRLDAIDLAIERIAARPVPSLTFEMLGVDLLLVDEAHYFKRLPIVSRMEGISLGASRRASDLMLKSRILRSRRGRLPSLALFTGTPWSNTIAETFVWQSFVQPDVLAEAGIDQFDAWAAVFVEYETLVEVTPDASGIRLRQRPSRIRNLPELQQLLAGSADVLPAAALGLERPARDERTVVCEPTPGQRAYTRGLAARADKIRREQVRSEPGGDNMLALCGDGRRAALDPVLVGVTEPSSKIAALADEVARVHDEHAGQRFEGSEVLGVLQVVFCDQGTPGADGLQTYGRVRIALAERGIPAERVRMVHEATTGPARARLFDECRSGAVSVLIGSTDKLGVGTNVQARLRAVHHLDAPWRPSDIEQREGRALRPGNGNACVTIVRYVTRGSFDAYMWQTLRRKAAFVEQLYRTDPGTRSIDDVGETVLTFAEVKALATGNALLLEQAEAAADLARLRLLRSLHLQSVTAAKQSLASAEQEHYELTRQHAMLLSARDRLTGAATTDATSIIATASGTTDTTDTDRESAAVAAAADVLHARLDRGTEADDPAPVRVPWAGLGVELIRASGWRSESDAVELRITLAHRRVDTVVLPAASLGRGAAGCSRAVLAALHRWGEGLDHRIVEVADLASDALAVAEQARRTIRRDRFGRADELAAAELRLAEIRTALEASVVD